MFLPPQDKPTGVRQARVFITPSLGLKPPPPVEWVVEGLFSRPSINLLVGDPGSKKTVLALDLAACVALGKPWLGKPVVQSPITYVDEELGMQRFLGRANAALQAHGAVAETPFHFA